MDLEVLILLGSFGFVWEKFHAYSYDGAEGAFLQQRNSTTLSTV